MGAITEDQQKILKPGILSLSIKDKAVLLATYMPFLKYGGLFIPTSHHYAIGTEVFILLNLLEEPERLAVTGTVAWITPEGAARKRPSGIGIQFKDPQGKLRRKIETLLEGQLNADTPTCTL